MSEFQVPNSLFTESFFPVDREEQLPPQDELLNPQQPDDEVVATPIEEEIEYFFFRPEAGQERVDYESGLFSPGDQPLFGDADSPVSPVPPPRGLIF
ncbi:MAG: hypothetical protein ACFB4I_01865 [Cyanophyceae cyanobacterium]